MGSAAGFVASLILRRRRAVALKNIDLAFGDNLSDREKKRLFRKSMQNFGCWFLDVLRYERMSLEQIKQQVVFKPEGIENWKKARTKGRGVILVGQHFGSWELMALTMGTFFDEPMVVIGKELHNDLLDRWVVDFRGMTGNEVVYSHEAGMKMLRALRQGRTVFVLADQAANPRKDGIFVPVLGQECAMTRSTATMSIRTGAEILIISIRPLAERRIEIDLVPLEDYEPSGDMEKDVYELTSRCFRILDEDIRRNPDCYFWIHKRWKYRPEGLPPAYE
jgi:KDO2-lipid IV(A) lauroyltransferase